MKAEKNQALIQKANDVYRAAYQRQIDDIGTMAELRGQYDGDMDRLRSDLDLARAVRKRRAEVRAATEANSAKKNDGPLPETKPATATTNSEPKNKQGFNASRYAKSEMTEEDLVASGF